MLDHQNPDLYQFLEATLEARQALMECHQALRLYNGFPEGEPLVEAAQAFHLQHIPRIR
ncbi:MAG TPA: hypothetical protein VMV80_02335 [Anaerolineales bacterium]|nr:hypothetical protein [Anaerolineales bacterium]HUV91898.1 hypothetical protein [Anaerolineales bacterium]